jgi:hypothetical protein
VIVPHNHIPQNVLEDKPAGKEDQYCVYFFNDSHFGWCTATKLTLMEKGKTLPKTKKSDLRVAYNQLKEYCNNDDSNKLEEFLRSGNVIPPDEEFVLGPPLPPATKKESNNTTQSKRSGKPLKSEESKPRKKRVISESDDESEERQMNGKKIKEEETEEQKTSKVQTFRAKLQRGLLQRKDEPTEEELKICSGVLKELEDFSPLITTELLKVSKLHKVLRAILKVDSLRNPYNFQFHERAGNLIVAWSDFIHEIKLEKDGERLRTETPNSSVLGSNADVSTQNVTESKEAGAAKVVTDGKTESVKSENAKSVSNGKSENDNESNNNGNSKEE